MATRTHQRIGIWIIAGALVLGTLGGFLAMVLAPNNDAAEKARMEQLSADWQKKSQEAQAKVDVQAKELSAKYYPEFSQYGSRVSAFDAASVTELKTEDVKVGEGADLTEGTSFTAYYIGWNPSGKVFDQSIAGEALKAPIEAVPGGVIVGWTEGVKGMKVGGVRELTIPAAKAYGEQAKGEDIPANTPLKFVLMVIPTPEKIEQPEFPDELLKYYQRQM